MVHHCMQRALQDAATVRPQQTVKAIPGPKVTCEKARRAANGMTPDTEQIVAAFEGFTFKAPDGEAKISLGKKHQGILLTC